MSRLPPRIDVRATGCAVLLLLAGCLGTTEPSPEEPSEPDWAWAALPSGEGHDHTDPAQHNATTPNFLPLGFDPMVSDHYGQTAGGYLCGDTAETQDGRRLAAVESRSDVGFALVDVTDPADPEWLGELVMENSYVYDLVVVPDGRHVVLVTAHTKGPELPPVPSAAGALAYAGHGADGGDGAGPVDAGAGADDAGGADGAAVVDGGPGDGDAEAHEGPDDPPDGAPRLLFHGPCGTVASDPVPREASILLVDISDPAEPVITNHQRLLGLGHSAFSVDQDGRLLVMAVTLGPDLVNSWVQLFEVADAGGLGVLVPLSNYRAPTDDTDGLQGNLWHDGWIEDHADGWRLHVVGGHNYHVLDIDDPRQPVLLATWSDDDPDAGAWTGNLHGVIPIQDFRPALDIAIVGPEWGGHPEDHPTGVIRVLDISDLGAMHEIGAWTLPHDVFWEEGATYQFSNHYYAVEGDTMFVSMYHGGIWAVDLAGLAAGAWSNLPSIGVWQSAVEADSAITFRWAPTNEEVFVFDGTVVTFDSNTGLHTATWTGEPMPAPEPWPVRPLG